MNGPNIYHEVWDTGHDIARNMDAVMAKADEDEWVVFKDGDSMWGPVYHRGHIIEKYIEKYPDAGLFTCVTNRIGNPQQVAEGVDMTTDDMRYHFDFGLKTAKEKCYQAKDVTSDTKISGILMVVNKRYWEPLKKQGLSGMAGVDNAIHDMVKTKGGRVYIMEGLYLYHYYSGFSYQRGQKRDTRHLKPDFKRPI